MITIVIPNYNGNKYLEACIESIYKQTYREYEIIIVDNASTDSDYKWIKDNKEVKFISLDKNYGFSRAVNEGIRLAKGEYVLLLNNDTELDENFLWNMLCTIKKDKNIFSVSSKMLQYYNRELIDDAGDEYTAIGWARKRGEGEEKQNYSCDNRVFSTCAGAALYRKSIFQKIGYFDERFFAYLEDVDISYRANIYGFKNVFSSQSVVYHIGSATSGNGYSDFKIHLSARNNIYLLYKNMPAAQLIINFPLLLLGYMKQKQIYTRMGYGKAYRAGIEEGIKTYKDIEKVPWCIRNLCNYIYVEWILIINTFLYVFYPYIKKKIYNK